MFVLFCEVLFVQIFRERAILELHHAQIKEVHRKLMDFFCDDDMGVSVLRSFLVGTYDVGQNRHWRRVDQVTLLIAQKKVHQRNADGIWATGYESLRLSKWIVVAAISTYSI
jgi:hypothetical protein